MKVSQNHIGRLIMDILEFNLCILLFSFNIAAIYLKYTEGCKGSTEADIMQYCHAITFKYYKAMKNMQYCHAVIFEYCKAIKNHHRLIQETVLNSIFI